MNAKELPHITEEETDILQEVMNIAFGKATADLAEVIETFVRLSVPYVQLLNTSRLVDYVAHEIREHDAISMIEQPFWGKFKGTAFLAFSAGAGNELMAMLGHQDKLANEPESFDSLEKETLVEVANILVGACISKIAELLSDTVTYSPPHVLAQNLPIQRLAGSFLKHDGIAIVMRTVFSFEERDVSGILFLVSPHESFDWLKAALNRFMEQYE